MATVFEVLDQKFGELRSIQEKALVSGAAKDHAEYREMCGVIRGLALAQREVADLAKHIAETEDN
jgi:hypothetical protein